MLMRMGWLVLIGLLAGGKPAWADNAPVTAETAEVLRQIEAAPRRGLLYEISKNGQTGWLFGTLHVGKSDFFPLERIVTQAVAQASELMVEADLTQAEGIAASIERYAVLPQEQSLDSLLTASLRQRLKVQVDALSLPRDNLQPFKPWMAGLSLVMAAIHQSGYDSVYASDGFLIGLAKGLDKPIVELEGMAFQLKLFDDIPRKDQLVFLGETLTQLEKGTTAADTRELVNAWLASDAKTLHQLSQKSLRDSPRSARWMQQKLFTERNQRMAQKIEQRLAAGHAPFVAVGALHLTGRDGVPDLLKKRGYRVNNLYP